ncbi:hypothetical protein [Viscerimonas tarda]
MKKFSTTVTDEIPPFGRNDSPVSDLRDEEAAASPPLPHKGDPVISKKETVIGSVARNPCSYQQFYRKGASNNRPQKAHALSGLN